MDQYSFLLYLESDKKFLQRRYTNDQKPMINPEIREDIQRKLAGKELTYPEIYAIMDEIANGRLGDVLTAYFAASGYAHSFSDEELYFLTKAMIETGDTLEFKGIVADKHSIGGVPGTRTTLIVVPIVASAGFLIPKSSSRAITTPGGTADDMETLANVTFNKEEIYRIVKKTNGCIVWGGGVDIAPADDELIRVEKPLMHEGFDKILVSIMAKKVAFGSNHIVIDLPYGPHVKVKNIHDAKIIKEKFEFLARKFSVKIEVIEHKVEEPVGRGIGPTLETKDALLVLEQDEERPLDLEKRALKLAGNLLDLCLTSAGKSLNKEVKEKFGNGNKWAEDILKSGQALLKMKEIIQAQNGDPEIKSVDLLPGKFSYQVKTKKKGTIKNINSKNATLIAKILGAPHEKKSGIFLDKKVGDQCIIGDTVYTLYSESEYKLKEAKDSMDNFPIIEF